MTGMLFIASHQLSALAQTATDGILNSLVAGFGIALLAWAVTYLFGRHGSGTRFAVWFSALMAIVALPWVYHLEASRGSGIAGVSRGTVTLPASFASYLFAAWVVGAAYGLLRVAFGLYRLRQLRSTCRPVDPTKLGTTLCEALVQAQAHRRVRLCSSDSVRVPASMGYFRPIVVFPTWALQEIPADELQAIFLHELAHLRRWDDWTNLAQKILKAIFFFNPAVWFIENRLSLEREMACDDAVLAANFSPRAYVESLLGIAEKSFLRRGVQLAQAAVGQVQQLKLRIVEILRRDREKRSSSVWKPAVAVMAVAGIASLYSVSRAPRLISFAADGPEAASAVATVLTGPLTTDARLRPVNLSMVTDRSLSSRSAHGTPTAPPRIRQVAQKPHVALAQDSARQLFNEADFVARPLLVLSNLATLPETVHPSVVLVVVRGEQHEVDGPVFWQVTIFHLTKAQQRVVAGGSSKQI